MYCPFCDAEDTKVIDSRLVDEGTRVRRRRECAGCGSRFTTFEESEQSLPRVVKRDGSRQTFCEKKLRIGLLKSLEKRSVPSAAVDDAIFSIKKQLRGLGDKEVPASFIGELVMQALKKLDQVAYVRFASVYRSFEDIDAFRETIQTLEEELNE